VSFNHIDPKAGGAASISETSRFQVHEGIVWHLLEEPDLAAGGSIDFTLDLTNALVDAHTVIEVSGPLAFQIELLERYDTPRLVELTPENRQRRVDLSADSQFAPQMLVGSVPAGVGTQIDLARTATGGKLVLATGASGEQYPEWILFASERYALRVTNLDADDAQTPIVVVTWYEVLP